MNEIEAIILDTETTGLKTPQVVECAFISLEELSQYPETSLMSVKHRTYESRFCPTKPIEYGAQRIHGITMADVKGLPRFDYNLLPISDTTKYIIGHNISYDHRAMGKVSPLKRICTLKLAKKLWPGLESYKLVAIMQEFFPESYEQIVADAHGAMVDVKLCLALLTKAVIEFEFECWEDVYEIGGQS